MLFYLNYRRLVAVEAICSAPQIERDHVERTHAEADKHTSIITQMRVAEPDF